MIAVSGPRTLELFERSVDAFQAARRSASGLDAHYSVAGNRLTLSFAGPSLASSLTGALAHLRVSDPAADRSNGPLPGDLTVYLWDAQSTGVAPPPPTWDAHEYLGNGEIRDPAERRLFAAFDSYLGTLSLYDPDRRLALFWMRDGREMPITLAGTPLRIIFQWWAAQSGGQLVHAAAVGTGDAGVAIAGPSGAGKSTTALIALRSGLAYAGDDFVLVRPEPSPRVHSLYNSAKLDDRTLEERFPELRGAVSDRRRLPREKQLVFVHLRWPERIALDLPLRALLLPVITGRTATDVVSVPGGDALRALVPSLFTFPGSDRSNVERLAQLVRALPAYRLELGTEPAGVESAVRSVLEASVG